MSFLRFETNKVLNIKIPCLDWSYRITFVIIALFFFIFQVWYFNGYQEFDNSIASVITINQRRTYLISENITSPFQDDVEVFDSAGFVVPPKEDGGFFIMTNQIITPYQTQSLCPEDPKVKDSKCKTNAKCLPALRPIKNGNGITTGKCVRSDRPNITDHVCEVYAWCPTESNEFSTSSELIDEASNTTVFIQIDVNFPKFDYKSRNIKKSGDLNYLLDCFHDSKKDPYCPIFKIGELVQLAGDNLMQVARLGAIYSITVNWDCNLDCDRCKISYSVNRLDDKDNPLTSGYKIRSANKFFKENKLYRNVTRGLGLKFQIVVTGKARKFDFQTMLKTFLINTAWFTLAAKLFDFLIPCCFCINFQDKDAIEEFRKKKFKEFNYEKKTVKHEDNKTFVTEVKVDVDKTNAPEEPVADETNVLLSEDEAGARFSKKSNL